MKYSDSKIYTIGHSTHEIEEFIEMLRSFLIEVLIDVRSLPGSNKFPQFNQDALEKSLSEKGIKYIYEEGLGGRRKVNPNSVHTIWKNKSFRGYADYMDTDGFKNALKLLKEIAENKNTVYMCAEAVWWRCHRSMISDALKAEGWRVMHIMGVDKATEHPYTKPAEIKNGKLFYGVSEDE